MNNKGSVTIFTALLLTSFLILIFAFIESARIISSKANAQEINNISVDACFSKYAKEMFNDYKVFGLWKTKDEVEEDSKYYISQNLKNNKDIFKLKLADLEVGELLYLTDNSGENMAKQVDEYMKYMVGEALLSNIIEKIKGISGGGKIEQFFEKISDCVDVVTSVEESVFEISEKLDIIKENLSLMKKDVLEMNGYLEEILSYSGNKEGIIKLKGYYGEKCQYIKTSISNIKDSIEKIYSYKYLYNNCKEIAGGNIKKMEKILQDSKEELAIEVYNTLNEQIKDLELRFGNENCDYYGIDECIENLREAETFVDEYEKRIEELSQKAFDGEFSEKMILESKDLKIEKCVINYCVEKIEKSSKSIIKIMKKLFSKGILTLVVSDISKISDKDIEVSDFPSRTSDYNKKYSYHDFFSPDESIRKILFSEYVLQNFKSFLDGNDTEKLEYEIEYIIAGDSSDKRNLALIVNKLVAIRMGFNFAYLLTDKEKCIEAEAMAAGIVGITGSSPLIMLTKIAILGVWSKAEAIIDVRKLLEGKKVSLVKKKDEWNTSLAGLGSFYSQKYEKSKENGLNYEDYLRFLLVSQNKVIQIYRTMDMIQSNVQEKYNEDFLMQEVAYKVKCNCEYKIKQLFSIPGMKKSYRYDIVTEFSY